MQFESNIPALYNLAQLLKLQQLQRQSLISQNVSPPPPPPTMINPYMFAIQQHLIKTQRQVQNCSPPPPSQISIDRARGAAILRRLNQAKAENDSFKRRHQGSIAKKKMIKRQNIQFVKQLNQMMLGKGDFENYQKFFINL